jgi:hypothetical protein
MSCMRCSSRDDVCGGVNLEADKSSSLMIRLPLPSASLSSVDRMGGYHSVTHGTLFLDRYWGYVYTLPASSDGIEMYINVSISWLLISNHSVTVSLLVQHVYLPHHPPLLLRFLYRCRRLQRMLMILRPLNTARPKLPTKHTPLNPFIAQNLLQRRPSRRIYLQHPSNNKPRLPR